VRGDSGADEGVEQDGAKRVICIAPEQGIVPIKARCDGAKKGMTSGTVENLYVNGADLPSVRATISAKAAAVPHHRLRPRAGHPSALTSSQSVAAAGSTAKIVPFNLKGHRRGHPVRTDPVDDRPAAVRPSNRPPTSPPPAPAESRSGRGRHPSRSSAN
jgi:hypothetical protein